MATDDEVTPPDGYSYLLLKQECERVGRQLDHLALLSRKRIDLIAIARARKAEALAAKMRELADRFGAWPNTNAETVAMERLTVVARMRLYVTEARELIGTLPSRPILGKTNIPE
jgi:hypothetical protein